MGGIQISRDIELGHAEPSLESRNAAARERDLATAADSGIQSYDDLPDGTVVADALGVVIAWNRVASKLTGVPAEHVVGKRLEDALPLEDLDGRQWWRCIAPYVGLATRSGHPERLLLLPEQNAAAGARANDARELLVTARFCRPRPLAPVSRVVVSLRGTRAREREELSRAELVSTVAHELRSPLTSVKGFTATLLAKWDRFTDEQKRLMLETVEADADRVTRLISELLDIARIDSGRLTVSRQIVDVPSVVSRHVAGLVAAGEPPERFAVHVQQPLPELWADADKLDQVLANLLGNAVSHGGGTITVVVEPDGTTGTAVTIHDEGEGIPEPLQRRVFTKWWRSGRRGGTGLGLYIVRGLVEAHGGTITLGHGPAGGACFRFVLPDGAPELPA